MKIYIVEGSEGEYDRDITWTVAAYKNEKDAKTHCEKLNKLVGEALKNNQNKYKSYLDVDLYWIHENLKYNYYSTELFDKLIEEKET